MRLPGELGWWSESGIFRPVPSNHSISLDTTSIIDIDSPNKEIYTLGSYRTEMRQKITEYSSSIR